MNTINSQPIYVGTCGWSYPKDWKSVFYPDFIPSNRYLEYYSQVFSTVEIDSSFYHTPSPQIVQNWVDQTPPWFKFSVKVNQEVTHKTKLALTEDAKALVSHFHSFIPMEKANKIFGHLIQLPPSFRMEDHWDHLENFLNIWNEWTETEGKILTNQHNSPTWRPIIEFRHKSWMKERTFALLRAYEATYCAVVEPIIPANFVSTSPELFYLRLHGYGDKPFWKYNFSDSELQKWATKLLDFKNHHPKTTTVAYFNNHFSGYAVKNALDILPKLDQSPHREIEKVNKQFQRVLRAQKKLGTSLQEEQKKHKSLDHWVKK